MSATKESSLREMPLSEKIGVIAGGGYLPAKLLEALEQKNLESFVIAFEGQTDPEIYKGREHFLTHLGAAGKIIKTLQERNIQNLVLIGSIKRPSIHELKPDMKTAGFLGRVSLRALGDDGLLKAVQYELEQEGFKIHGIQEYVSELLAEEGTVGKYASKKADQIDIKRGIEVLKTLGQLDIGQSVIVRDGIVLGVEAAEGTDELIRRCKSLNKRGVGGVLVKGTKPQQSRNMDLPTIGPDTVRLCTDCGLSGIVIEAGCTLLLNPDEVAILANEHKMFVTSLDMSESSYVRST